MTEAILIGDWIGGDSEIGTEIHANNKSIFGLLFSENKIDAGHKIIRRT